MDSSTMRDMIKDLQIEREQLRAQLRDLRALIRALEMERDNWQRLAVNNG